jgi:hypothetical protein
MDECLASIPLLLERFENDLIPSRSIILGQRIDPSLTSFKAWQKISVKASFAVRGFTADSPKSF